LGRPTELAEDHSSSLRIPATSVEQSAEQLRRAESPIELQLESGLEGLFDPLRIETVTVNILDNAVKFGAGRPIRVRLVRRGDLARLEIQDHGTGIPAELQPRLLERFSRGVSARHYGGLGLGLYIAREIVEAHGGTIWVESAPGAGTTVKIELPLVRTPPVP
jgi:signal transduction histidine kinase